ncbi:MAG: redoxin domain-containing protein [Planctomycetes bacterium]|nr:redoxin domain-containing protein [Planctomycetota bacterium]MBI3845917.1 redoxin domain-containing protein [Planctomycetota bacterium]
MKPRLKTVTWGIVLGCLALAPSLAWAQDSPKPKAATTTTYKVGDRVKPFTLTDLNGKKVTLSEFKDKVIVLHFFGKDAADALVPLQKDLIEKHTNDGLVVLAVSGDDESDLAKIVEKSALTCPVLLDRDREVATTFGLTKAPLSVVIAPDMKIVHLLPGTDVKDLRDKVEKVLQSNKKTP